MYNPNIKKANVRQTTWFDRVSDKLFGTNFTGRADQYNREQAQLTANANQYEYQKANLANNYMAQQAVNTNKYAWNVQGMTQAGINPMAAMSNIGSIGAGPAAGQGAQGASAGGMSQGGIGEVAEGMIQGVKDILHEVNPINHIRELKNFAKSII